MAADEVIYKFKGDNADLKTTLAENKALLQQHAQQVAANAPGAGVASGPATSVAAAAAQTSARIQSQQATVPPAIQQLAASGAAHGAAATGAITHATPYAAPALAAGMPAARLMGIPVMQPLPAVAAQAQGQAGVLPYAYSRGGGARPGAFGFNPLTQNAFSMEGAGRLVGNATLVAAATIAARTAAGGIEAARIRSDIDTPLRSFQDAAGGTLTARSDPFLRDQAGKLASARGGLESAETWKSVPVLGAFAQLADAASGTSAALRKAAEGAERAAAGHIAVARASQDSTVRSLARNGDAAGAFAMTSNRELANLSRLAQTPQDRAAVSRMAELDQSEATRLRRSDDASRQTAIDRVGSEGLRRESITEARSRDTIRSMELRQEADRTDFNAEAQERLVNTPSFQRDRVEKTLRARAQTMLAEQSDERLDAADRIDRSIALSKANTEANQLRAQRRPVDAELRLVDANRDERLRTSDIRQADSIRTEAESQKDEIRSEHAQDQRVRDFALTSEIEANKLRVERRGGEADALLFGRDQQLRILSASPESQALVARAAVSSIDAQITALTSRGGASQFEFGKDLTGAQAQDLESVREQQRARQVLEEIRDAIRAQGSPGQTVLQP